MSPGYPLYTFVILNEEKPYQKMLRRVLIAIKLLLMPFIIVIHPSYWIPLVAVLALLSLVEYRAISAVPSVSFYDTQILFSGAWAKKKYSWELLNNVILKDSLLTIDFNNNRLFQKETDAMIDEKEFNAWSRKKLSALKSNFAD